MFNRESCVRVADIPFAAEKTQTGAWVSRYDEEAKRFALIPYAEAYAPKEPVHNVIEDSMAPAESQVSGKIYDSKSAIRAEYKREGFVELGNDLKGRRKGWTPAKETMEVSMRRASEKLQTSTYREELAHKRARGLIP